MIMEQLKLSTCPNALAHGVHIERSPLGLSAMPMALKSVTMPPQRSKASAKMTRLMSE